MSALLLFRITQRFPLVRLHKQTFLSFLSPLFFCNEYTFSLFTTTHFTQHQSINNVRTRKRLVDLSPSPIRDYPLTPQVVKDSERVEPSDTGRSFETTSRVSPSPLSDVLLDEVVSSVSLA
jgi:hypothetical protein